MSALTGTSDRVDFLRNRAFDLDGGTNKTAKVVTCTPALTTYVQQVAAARTKFDKTVFEEPVCYHQPGPDGDPSLGGFIALVKSRDSRHAIFSLHDSPSSAPLDRGSR